MIRAIALIAAAILYSRPYTSAEDTLRAADKFVAWLERA